MQLKQVKKGSPEGNIVQSALDVFSDDVQLQRFLNTCKDEQKTVLQGLRENYAIPREFGDIFGFLVAESGMDFTSDTLLTIGKRKGITHPDYWDQSYQTVVFKNYVRQRYYRKVFGDAAYIFTDVPEARERENQLMWRDQMLGGQTLPDTFESYRDESPRRDLTLYNEWRIQDLCYRIIPLMPGETLRIPIFKVNLANRYTEVGEGGVGALITLSQGQLVDTVNKFRAGILHSEEWDANDLRLSAIVDGKMQLADLHIRKLNIDGMNLIAANVPTGNTPYGKPHSLSETDTQYTIKMWKKLENSYEVTQLNRILGRRDPVTDVEFMRTGAPTDNSNVVQMIDPKQTSRFYDLGSGDMARVGLAKLNDTDLHSDYTETNIFTMDVMRTMILVTAPAFEQNEMVKDAAAGLTVDLIGTAAQPFLVSGESIRKQSWA